MQLNPKQELSITFVSELEMEDLHMKWMAESGPTDVMSFRLSEISEFDFSLGDIVICPAVAERDALKQKIMPAKHLVFLLIHGLLHLVGFDHQIRNEKLKMQAKEEALMNSIMLEYTK